MIFDRIDHAHRYRSLSESFRKAFDFLASLDLSALTEAVFPLTGKRSTPPLALPPSGSRRTPSLKPTGSTPTSSWSFPAAKPCR